MANRRTSSEPTSTPQTAEQRTDHRKRPRTHRARVIPSLPDEHVLTERELLERIPLDRQTIRRLVAERRFPKPIQLTRSKKGWRWSAVLAWLAEREENPLPQREYFRREPTTDESSA